MTNIDSRFLSSRDVGSSLEKFNAKSFIIGVGPVLIVVKFDTHISPKKRVIIRTEYEKKKLHTKLVPTVWKLN